MKDIILLLMGGLLLASPVGCVDNSKQLEEAKRELEIHLKELDDPRNASSAIREYSRSRTREALDYLGNRRSLQEPYVESAVVTFADGRREIGVIWIEGDAHVVGVVFSFIGEQGRRQWSLRVFDWLQAQLARPEAAPYREMARKLGRIRLLRGDVEEPSMRYVNDPGEGPPVEVIIPQWMQMSTLEAGVYDEKNRVSNLVPLFIWPEE